MSIIALVFALVAGVIAITLSAASYKQSRSAHIIPHVYLVGSVNVIIIVNALTLYFYQNLSSAASISVVSAVDTTYQILMPPLQVLAVCSLMHLSSALIGARSAKPRLRRCVILAACIAALQITLSYCRFSIADVPALYFAHRLIEVVALAVAYLVIGTLISRVARVKPIAKRKAIRTYAVMLVSALTLAVLALLLGWLDWIPPDVYTVALAVLVLAANLVPVLYYQRFLLPRFDRPGPSSPGYSEPESLDVVYGISPREREVLDFLCKGHSNQEIADVLFISLQTVKDHVSHIYRKMGVKNRVQLMAMLSGRFDKHDSGDSEE